MLPTRDLPPHYRLQRSINLAQDPKLLLGLNLASLPLLFISFAVFEALSLRLNGHSTWESMGMSGKGLENQTILVLFATMAAFALTILLHELVHGAFFWLNTGTRPVFALKLSYAYAAAPGWYIPRNRYLPIGLAPLVLISLAGVLILPWLPVVLLMPWLVAMAGNASGAIGDLYIVAVIARMPEETLVEDHGDGMDIYLAPEFATPNA